MSSCLTSESDGEVAKPLRLQRYTKKMTLANKSAIFMNFKQNYLYYISLFSAELCKAAKSSSVAAESSS